VGSAVSVLRAAFPIIRAASPPTIPTDWELVEGARQARTRGEAVARAGPAGDGQAFAALFERHAQAVYSFLCHLTRDSALADDLTQETFLAVYRNLDRLRPKRATGGFNGSLRPWLLRVARNRAMSHLRKPASREVVQADVGSLLARPLNVSSGREGRPEETLIRSETVAEVRRVVADLPARYREPILLHYSAGLSYTEIGVALGLPLGTVATRLRRGLARVAAALELERDREGTS